MTGLFQYYMPEGGFMHVAADAGNNGGGAGGIIDGMATEQGLYATVAYRRFLDGETFLYDMSDVAISAGTKPVVSPTIDTGSNSGGNSSSTTAKKTETKPAVSKIKVIKMGLNYSTIYLTKGKSKTLKATVSPSNATKKSVKWSSSNKKIVTVNAKGKVTGKKAGTVTITVKATDGSGKKAACKVVVTAPETTDKKTTIASTAATSQTRQITIPAASSTGSSRTSVPATRERRRSFLQEAVKLLPQRKRILQRKQQRVAGVLVEIIMCRKRTVQKARQIQYRKIQGCLMRVIVLKQMESVRWHYL